MRRGTQTKVAKEMCGVRRIATPTKYAYVGSMKKDLDIMVETLRNWVQGEEEAIASGRANFNCSRYYAHLADVLEKASVEAEKISRVID